VNIASVVSALQRVRPRQQQPGVVPDDETDNQPSYAAPQPDVASARVPSAVVPTAPDLTPQSAFNRSMTRVQGTPAPDPFATRVSSAPVAVAPASGQVDGHVAQERVPSYEDIPMPPKAPELADVKPSTPMPTREMHHGGVGSRVKDAAKFGLRSLLLSGGNPLYALGAGVGALVNPQAEHDQKYNREMATWEPRAQAEMSVIEQSNKGKIQQGAAQNQYYDNLTGREKLIDSRVARTQREQDRATTAGERVATRQDTEAKRKHEQAKDHVTFNAAHGLPNDPAIVKGTVYESLGGKTITPDKVPHFEAGGRLMYDPATKTLVPSPGAENLPEPHDPNELTPYQKQEIEHRDVKDAEAQDEKAKSLALKYNETRAKHAQAAKEYGQMMTEIGNPTGKSDKGKPLAVWKGKPVSIADAKEKQIEADKLEEELSGIKQVAGGHPSLEFDASGAVKFKPRSSQITSPPANSTAVSRVGGPKKKNSGLLD
jgi:hypothetical protein